MDKRTTIWLFLVLSLICQGWKIRKPDSGPEYMVRKLTHSMHMDADWNKPEWRKAGTIGLNRYMGGKPHFFPDVKAKMMFDSANLYIIFKVKDRYVRCVNNEINGPVWEDSCVEFFFSPDSSSPGHYFNLEINCGGTALMHFNYIPRKKFDVVGSDLIRQIEIAHSLPEIVDPEYPGRKTWVVEARLPFRVLRKYSPLTLPASGVVWKANFYNIADKTSHPRYLTWSEVINPTPDFHLPEYFGKLVFQ